MLVEPATITALVGGNITLHTPRAATCGKCSMKTGCGQYLLAGDRQTLSLPRNEINVGVPEAQLQSGTEFRLCMEEQAVLGFTLLFYLLPLAFLLGAALLATALGAGEAVTALSALLGLTSGFLCLPRLLRQKQQSPAWRPSLQIIQSDSGCGVTQ
jgi:positive regulator of sigma E activity